MEIDELQTEINNQTKEFMKTTGITPNALFLNKEHKECLDRNLEKIIRMTKADVESSEIATYIKTVDMFMGMRMIIIEQFKNLAVGYVKFRDGGMAIKIEPGKQPDETKPQETETKPAIDETKPKKDDEEMKLI